MRWLVALVFVAACGGAAANSSPEPPSNTVAEPVASTADSATSSDVEDIEPGELDRAELCSRAMDNVVRLLALGDQNEIRQTHTAGVRDCIASEASRDDIRCLMNAPSIEHMAACHEFSN